MDNKNSYISLYNDKNSIVNDHLLNLEKIINDSNSVLEGNCFYYHTSLNRFPQLFNKQVNLMWAGMQAEKKICEIGFNAGHSAMLFLLSRNNIENPCKFVVFDIGHHNYMLPCYEYIKNKHPEINFDLIVGDSTIEMTKWVDEHPEETETFDLIHIDGGHALEIAKSDCINSDKLLRKGGIAIMDDTQDPVLDNFATEFFIKSRKYIELDILPSNGYKHRMFRKKL